MNCSHCGRYIENGRGISGGSGSGIYCGEKCFQESGAKKNMQNQYKMIFIIFLLGIMLSPGILLVYYLAPTLGQTLTVPHMWIFSSVSAIAILLLLSAILRSFKRGAVLYGTLCVLIIAGLLFMTFVQHSDIVLRIMRSLGVGV